ncbi:hypothetical protein ES288_D04G065400v1 [Gossypium darwinii]|uniref:Uncharacterized protein n=1 Tax=Gossypium darwinii TaxID=34276 RepID=A0A5D2CTK9_GOSDA|nr:hypothetical protein ES288_D04G065400v1 [Gossypium darwinii]
MEKLSFAFVLVLPISSALFYPSNPKATSTLSLPTSNRTAPYIFPYFPSFVPEGNCKKTGGTTIPITLGKSKRPPRFRAGTRALTRSQDFLDLHPFWVRAISYQFAPNINRCQADALVAIQEVW